jgi:3-oxoacyl-[acyl-carrier protein] reductase
VTGEDEAGQHVRPGASRLDGRVVAITGAGRGLGLLTTRVLLDQGARVIANHRSPSAALSELQDKHTGTLHLVPGDVGEEATAEAIAGAARALGRLDVLVHNAAITRDQALVRMPVEDWDEVQRVNLRGAFLTTKHALRLMMRRRYGRVIYISSVSAVVGNAGQANYAASKAGLHGLSHSVAQEYAGYNIRSVVIAPGLLGTGLGAAMDPALRDRKAERFLLDVGDTGSVAATIAFFAGPEADFVNASVVRIDGGFRF